MVLKVLKASTQLLPRTTAVDVDFGSVVIVHGLAVLMVNKCLDDGSEVNATNYIKNIKYSIKKVNSNNTEDKHALKISFTKNS